MRRSVVTAVAVLLTAAGLLPAAAGAQAQPTATTAPSVSADSPAGTYVANDPERVYDTRANLHRPLKPGESVKVRVASIGHVTAASEVEAVVITLTTTGPTRNGYLAAYPSTSSGAGISTLTFAAGETRAVTATVPTSTGYITIRNAGGASAGTAHAIVDVQGYYRNGTQTGRANDYFPDYPYRLLDTRQGTNFQPGYSYELGVDADDYPEQTEALVLNVTATRSAAAGSLTAYSDYTQDPPGASTVNFTRGRTAANNAIVPVLRHNEISGSSLRFALFNGSRGTVDAIVDVVGFYASGENGLRFVPLTSPRRVLDSRNGTGGTRTLGSDSTAVVTTPSDVAVRGTTVALVGNLTATRGTASTYLTAYSTGDERPDTSNLNALPGQTVSNHAIVALTGSSFDLYNKAGSVDAIFDITGRFDYPGQATTSRRTAVQQADHEPRPRTVRTAVLEQRRVR